MKRLVIHKEKNGASLCEPHRIGTMTKSPVPMYVCVCAKRRLAPLNDLHFLVCYIVVIQHVAIKFGGC